ncbi:MAG: twin-arginine translocation signal domain-containing protein, partial [Chitinophagaceae bacterium]
MHNEQNRRDFLRKMSLATGGLLAGGAAMARQPEGRLCLGLHRKSTFSPNDQVNLALIGAGGMGSSDTDTALRVAG